MSENKDPRLVANLTYEQSLFLEAHSSRIGENYFIPYWFRRIGDNQYEMFSLGNLPADMSAEIEEMRNQVKRTSMFNMFDDNAYFKKP